MKHMKKKYGLKTISADYTSREGFKWPEKIGSIVTAPDWNEKPECGGGLHFALNGEGDGSLFEWNRFAIWVVAELYGEIIDLSGKVKVKQCKVLHYGTRETATEMIYSLCGMVACIGGTAQVGYRGIASAGDYGKTIAGDYGKASAGDYGKAQAGYRGMINIKFYDGIRFRLKVGYIGEDGLLPDTLYKLDENFNFVEA